MNEPKQVSQKKNLLGNSARRRAESMSGVSNETRDLNEVTSTAQIPIKSTGVDQRRALLRPAYVQGERLAEGETVFESESASTAKSENLHGSELHVDPVRAFARLRRLNWLIVSITTIIVASFLLMAFSQTATLAREIASLPAPASWIGFVSLSVLWLAIGVAAWHLVSSFVRLKRSPGVSMSSLGVLQERAENRRFARASSKFAEDKIRDFLRSYPDDKGQLELLGAAGFDDNTGSAKEFMERVQSLLRIDNGVPDQWLQRVRSQVVHPLEDAASRLIQRSAIQVGMATAISPRGSLDSLIVLVQSYRLVSELCRLYGVRPGGMETCYILGQSFLSVVLAAGGDNAADMAEEQLRENLQESIGLVAGSVLAKLGARLGEGTVNAMFVRRIGNRLKGYLCPISE